MQTIWIAGDSTASVKKTDKRPESGWGEYLFEFLHPSITIKNLAENGRSSKSFIDSGILNMIDQGICPGDILLIQFGHNDQKISDSNRYADVQTDYPKNIKLMIDVARKHGATPICLTPITRRDFIHGNLNKHTHLGYPDAMKAVAIQEGVQLIDLFSITQSLLTELGEEKSKLLFLHLNPGESMNYPLGITDNTHLNINGARKIASIVASQIIKK